MQFVIIQTTAGEWHDDDSGHNCIVSSINPLDGIGICADHNNIIVTA